MWREGKVEIMSDSIISRVAKGKVPAVNARLARAKQVR